jgi:hypothetical protein
MWEEEKRKKERDSVVKGTEMEKPCFSAYNYVTALYPHSTIQYTIL